MHSISFVVITEEQIEKKAPEYSRTDENLDKQSRSQSAFRRASVPRGTIESNISYSNIIHFFFCRCGTMDDYERNDSF